MIVRSALMLNHKTIAAPIIAAPATDPATAPRPARVEAAPVLGVGLGLAAADDEAPPVPAVGAVAAVADEVVLLVLGAPADADADTDADAIPFPTKPTPYAFVEAPSSAHVKPDMTCCMKVAFCHAKNLRSSFSGLEDESETDWN